MDEINVALLYGGPSAEHNVSLMSARSVLNNIDLDDIVWQPIAISKNGYWLDKDVSHKLLVEEYSQVPDSLEQNYKTKWLSIKENFSDDIDIVFSLLHGPYGEDGTLQGFLEIVNIPYVGSNVTTSAVCMDKIFAKDILAQNGFPQAQYITFSCKNLNNKDALNKIKDKIISEIGLPCFIKPASLGSSLGISKVKNESEILPALQQAKKFEERIIIEEAINGREIECSVRGSQENCRASLPGEIIPDREFYDYEAKYFSNETELIAPAELKQETVEHIQKLAVRAFRLLGGEGLARVDFFLTDSNEVLINEINTIPGFTERSMYPKMWEASNCSYENLVASLLKSALKNNGYSFHSK